MRNSLALAKDETCRVVYKRYSNHSHRERFHLWKMEVMESCVFFKHLDFSRNPALSSSFCRVIKNLEYFILLGPAIQIFYGE